MSLLSKAIGRLLQSGNYGKASIEEDSLLMRIALARTRFFRWKKWSFPVYPILNLVFVIAAFIGCFALALGFSVSLVKEELAVSQSFSYNAKGAIRAQLPAGKEYVMFLFNTSELWADSGIELRKGDRIKINISGSFHPSVGDLKEDAASNNPYPEMTWIRSGTANRNISQLSSSCISKEHPFGSFLYRIAPVSSDSLEDKDSSIRAWDMRNAEKFHPVKHNGILQFCVNDICTSYQDNLGQILVCAEIKHPLRSWFISPLSSFRNLKYQSASHPKLATNPLSAFLLMLLSMGTILVEFLLGALLLLALCYLAYLAPHYFRKLRRINRSRS